MCFWFLTDESDLNNESSPALHIKSDVNSMWLPILMNNVFGIDIHVFIVSLNTAIMFKKKKE